MLIIGVGYGRHHEWIEIYDFVELKIYGSLFFVSFFFFLVSYSTLEDREYNSPFCFKQNLEHVRSRGQYNVVVLRKIIRICNRTLSFNSTIKKIQFRKTKQLKHKGNV